MSLLDRVLDCTRSDADRRVPLYVDGVRWGLLDPDLALALDAFPDVFVKADDGVALHADLDTPEARTHAVGDVVRALAPRGFFGALRGELYPVCRRFGDAPVFAVERGAVGAFGTPAFGVHLNGFVPRRDGLHLWVGKRAADKPTFPGRLDHLVGGGQPMDIGLRANMEKECREEARVPEPQLRDLVHVHALRYRLSDEYGMHEDTMHVFDLALPPAFVPQPADGEVEHFVCHPVSRVIEILRTSRRFKTNVGLVIVDWLLRHGVLDDDPERAALEDALAPLRVPVEPDGG